MIYKYVREALRYNECSNRSYLLIVTDIRRAGSIYRLLKETDKVVIVKFKVTLRDIK